MYPWKSPGPDGYPVGFFHQSWNMVGNHACSFLQTYGLTLARYKRLIRPTCDLSQRLMLRNTLSNLDLFLCVTLSTKL